MGRSVLVVDDEPGIVTVLGRLLTDEGWTVTTAHDGGEALLAIGRAVPSVVLVDYVMPHMDAGVMIAALRRGATTKKLPIVIMSGMPEPMIRRKTKHYTAFIRKPFEIDELLATLDRAASPPKRKR